MLGPVGRLVSNYLRAEGFVIYRPSWIERRFTKGFWKNWFGQDPVLFSSVYVRNRQTVSGITDWVTEETLKNSLWRYGVPVEWSGSYQDSVESTGLIDIESEITASDILAFAARRLGDGVSYLEIGVSVGKNLIQVERQLNGASLVGLDVEMLNPVLRDQFNECVYVGEPSQAYEVETLVGSKVRKQTTFQRLTSAENTFEYLSGDQFRADTWERLAGRKFNLIFSDGVHTPEALRSEFQFLVKYDLIDQNRCVFFWDDLHNIGMQSAFLDNARALCDMLGKTEDAISLFRLHGSYGMQRPMGMFSSL